MMVKEKSDILVRPVLLKFGLALALSLGGILYTFFITKRNKPPKSKPSRRSPGNGVSQAKLRGESGEIKNDGRSSPNSCFPKLSSPKSISDVSSSGRHIGDRDGFLLPEFNELVKECTDDISPRKTGESLVPDIESPIEYKCAEHDEHDREIRNLQRNVRILQERERNLEVQLLEYYGLKEQETAVMELQNRLRLNNMESKLYNLKIESLQSDNRRLEAQVADYAKVVTELEAAKAKIKLLRKKLRSEAEQNREQILTLQERVMKLQVQEKKVVDNELQKRKELEEKLAEMKKADLALKLEKTELAQKLEYVQMIATSALDNDEIQELIKESRRLKQQNEDLTKKLEGIQADRCTDIEELVYLRWVNACLRYELRNYKPNSGKAIARDLSKTLSPKSEQRAKQLILEYANKEGSTDKSINTSDFDSDQWSSSQASYHTDSGEHDDSSVNTKKTNHSSKPKVIAKLMRLLRGKDNHHNQKPETRLERTVSVDDIVSRYCSDMRTSSGGSSRRSFDLQRSYSRSQKSTTGESSNSSQRTSDDGTLSIFRRIDSIIEDDDDLSPTIQYSEGAQNAEKIELVKYAEALKNSRSKSSSFRRRSSSVSSF
ncbi:hypothetical protein ACJIZ3_025435 [Penstemon smallii]|uniref:Protein CHUP1, chloroplastic-like n=1 Tax=Penstemon smallii TaxID=265156 RepID=A0ABD3TUM5_9LAMI